MQVALRYISPIEVIAGAGRKERSDGKDQTQKGGGGRIIIRI